MQKQILPLKTHAKIRQRLDQLDSALFKTILENPKTSTTSRRARSALQASNSIRHLLDDAVFAEHYKSKVDDKLTHVYYGR